MGYVHTYSHTTDTLDELDSGGYFPQDALRTGDVIVCEAADAKKLGFVINPSSDISWVLTL